jgi:hypothetical protein
MARREDKECKRLENHLFAMENEQRSAPAKKVRAYNSDRTDLDLDEFSETVRQGKKGGCLKKIVGILVLVALALAAYWLYQNGGLPWN